MCFVIIGAPKGALRISGKISTNKERFSATLLLRMTKSYIVLRGEIADLIDGVMFVLVIKRLIL